MKLRFIVPAMLCVAILACDRGQSPRNSPSADVAIEVTSGRIASPDTVPPGWSHVRVDEKTGSHIVVVFRLSATASAGDIASFLAALDTMPATPQPGVAMGGPEIGQSGEVILHFTPGRYVLGCVSRDDSGHRHVISGESASFVVTDVPVDPVRSVPPAATQEIRMTEFAYSGSDKWRAGPKMLRIENTGTQDHQLRLVRLKVGSSLSDWLNSDGSAKHGKPVVGLARMGPGEVAYLPVDLEAGSYVAYCFVTDGVRRKQHIELGMYRAIQVE